MKEDNQPIQEVSFNQAYYQQRRIDKLIDRINLFSVNPLIRDEEIGDYHYKVQFRDLCSLLSEINSKLKDDDEEKIYKFKNNLSQFISFKAIFNIFYDESNLKTKKIINQKNLDLIVELLDDFRTEINKLMEKYGFGNPNKKDVTKSAVDM